jgi:hypothetical protein
LFRAGSKAFLLVATALCGVAAADERAGPWLAGGYSFSDELGGFRIQAVSGTGTRDDPIIVEQEFNAASPVTLVIRAARRIRPFAGTGQFPNGIIHIRLVVLNNSGQAWTEFEFELQERLGEASLFGDGLSFDQRRTDSENISSDSFADYSRDFEPYDRLVYSGGHVDPLETAGFRMLITDFTPRWEFFLLQDPRIPFS